MKATVETCENCGKAIGKLESAQIWGDAVVCANCRRQLESESLPAERATLIPQQVQAHRSQPVVAAPQQPHVVIVQQPQQAQNPAPQIHNNVQVNQWGAPRVKPSGIIASLALICAVLALACSWVPIAGLAALPVAAIALALSLVGFLVNACFGGRLTTPFAAALLSLIAMVVSVAVAGGTAEAIKKARDAAERSRQSVPK